MGRTCSERERDKKCEIIMNSRGRRVAVRGASAQREKCKRKVLQLAAARSVSDLDSSNGINNESSFVSVKTAAMSAGDN